MTKMEYLHNLNPFGICFKTTKIKCTDMDVSKLLEFLTNHFLVVIKGFAFNKINDYLYFLEQLGKTFYGKYVVFSSSIECYPSCNK